MASEQHPIPPARISLVMPNYNHGRFIGQALGALLMQTRSADEIIIIDDASTDDSVSTIERLVHGRANVSVIRQKSRGGVLKALNDGLERASGDLIGFPAADDMVGPDFLRKTERLLQRFPGASFCSACVELVDSEGARLGTRPILRPVLSPEYVPAKSARSMLTRGDNFFLGQVCLYRRGRLLDLGGFDASLGASSDGMMQRRMAVRWGFCFIPEVLGTWRLHGANFSTSAVESAEKVDQLIELNQRVVAAEPPGLFPEGYAQLFERRLRFNAARVALLHCDNKTPSDEQLWAICSIVHATWIDRMMLRTFQRLKLASALLMMGWLAMRLRPFSFTWLGMEAVRRLVSQGVRLS